MRTDAVDKVRVENAKRKRLTSLLLNVKMHTDVQTVMHMQEPLKNGGKVLTVN